MNRTIDNEDKLDISLYICTCRDFKTRQLPCKHIFAVISQLNNNNLEDGKQRPSLNSIVEMPVSINQEIKIKNAEIEKLQDDLSAIVAEWEDKPEDDIHSLRIALLQAAQMERTRIARVELVQQQIADGEELISQSQIASNIKFKKQIKF